jgi:shikimate dehydrogenase
MKNEDTQSDRYALIGHPVSHSRSPFIHGMFAAATAQHMRYELIEVLPDRVADDIQAFFARGGKGLNVTVPHKEIAADTVDILTTRASDAHAVNTIFRDESGALIGDNTDGVGLTRDLEENLNLTLAGANILILGAGGATRGVVGPLLDRKPSRLCIANRTLERAADLAARHLRNGHIHISGFHNIARGPFDLIINATSAGLSGATPPVSTEVIHRQSVCYDMSYKSGGTPFTIWAQEQGAAMAHQGLGMLVEQAAEAFFIWRGIRPDTAPVLRALRDKDNS